MLHVSIFVELLRSQPRLMVWIAALSQAALWWIVPSLFYAAPPGNLPEVLAIGHEFQLGSYAGPPLAHWLAEVAFFVGGMTGVYLLAQICVVATYWAVFALGREIVGVHHATMAVLLMVGIAVFTVPTPDFGPAILAMPLTAFAIVNFWYAVGEGRRGQWFILALEVGVLLLTSYAGLILFALMLVFVVTSKRGRAALATIEPWIASVIIVVVVFPHLIWLDAAGGGLTASFGDLHGAAATGSHLLIDWGRQIAAVLVAHAGAFVLVALATGWRGRERVKAPIFLRGALSSFERRFVYFFALAPPLAATFIGALLGERGPLGGLAPHVVLSGLAIVVAAGNMIALHRQRVIAAAWSLLLIAPPAFAAAAIFVLPWAAGVEIPVIQPAREMGRFFAESFERRTGRPLAIVAGEQRLASLLALGAPSRPSLYNFARPERSPWVTRDDILRKGAIVVWLASDTAGLPPPEIKARFPELVPEVPRSFERAVQGRLALLRIGWGMIRPVGP
jgi:4-amino-4-deoxy-L-arabinose transferase-like glycosyltransferase